MAAPTRATMVSETRLLTQDTDTTVSTANTDAQITQMLNLALMWLYENDEKRVKYATLIADWDSTVSEKNGDSTCIYPEILEVYLNVSGTTQDAPLIRMDWAELRARQSSGDVAAGTPTHYAMLKYGGAAVGSGLQNLWKFALLPIPDADNNVLRGSVRDYPVQLSADADIVDLGDFEARECEVIAAIMLNRLNGRADLNENLMGLLPKMLRDKLTTHESKAEVNP